MKKLLLLSMFFITCSTCYSQDLTQYIHSGKMYQYSGWVDLMYHAAFLTDRHTLYGDHVSAGYIFIYENSRFVDYTSAHGRYVEVQYSQYLAGARCFTYSKNIVFYVYGYGLCAFTKNNNTLCLVNVKTDAVVSVFDSNFSEGDDFSILVKDNSIPGSQFYEPSFWITNNGYVKVYNDVSSHVSSVSSVRTEDNNSRMYNTGGLEIEKPKNEIFIQEGKKIIAK